MDFQRFKSALYLILFYLVNCMCQKSIVSKIQNVPVSLGRIRLLAYCLLPSPQRMQKTRKT